MSELPSKKPRMSVKELVQQQRGELYATGHQNLNMAIPADLINQIDLLKRTYRLRSRDAIVARVIRKCMMTIEPDAFVQRVADAGTVYRRISPIVPNELVDYVKQIQQRFRNIGYGPVFEMIFNKVASDLLSPAVQSEVIRRSDEADQPIHIG
jgi:hypothetical protein